MSYSLVYSTTFSLIILLATTLIHASEYRSYNGYYTQPNPTMPSYMNQGYQQPYYTQPKPTPPYQTPPTGQYTPYIGPSSDKATFLQSHNDARRSVGLPPMVWDERVAAFAQNWANQRINDCRLVHSNSPAYGENIFWGSGDYSAAFAVQTWVSERKYYNLYSNSCAGGMDCGHWTQIVWRTSTRLGCARVRCRNGGVFVTCNYDPPGNYIGSRPY